MKGLVDLCCVVSGVYVKGSRSSLLRRFKGLCESSRRSLLRRFWGLCEGVSVDRCFSMFDEVEFGICNGRLDKGCKRNKEQLSQTILESLYYNLCVIFIF